MKVSVSIVFSVRYIYIEANAINYAVRQQNVIDCSSSYLQKVDLRIEIFVPKLVYTGNFMMFGTAGKFVVAVQRNCWRTRYFTKIRKFEKQHEWNFNL